MFKMIIKRVYIEWFGKLSKKEFLFKPGINIIFGKNESGKTTLEQFLLTMLYGSRTSKTFGVDPRAKYIPFDKDFAYGQMVMEFEGKNILFERKVGQKRRDDVFRSFEQETLDQVSYDEHLGKQLFDLELEPFLKTLFVSQSGLKFQGEKDERLNAKLTNLLETGDEDVSYTKAMDILDQEMKKIKGTRKSGILDELQIRLNQRYKSLDEAKKNQEDRNVMDKKIQETSKAHEKILENLKDLSFLKGQIHLYEVQDQVNVIQESLDHIEKLKNQKEDEKKSLVTEEELERLNGHFLDVERQEEEIQILQNQAHGERRKLESLELDIEPYLGFSELPSDTALHMVKNQGEENLILEKLKHFNQEKYLNPKLLEKKEELGKLLHRYERSLKKLKPINKKKFVMFYIISIGIVLVQAIALKSLSFSLATMGLLILILIGERKQSSRLKTHRLKKAEKLEEKIRVLAHSLDMDSMEIIKSKRIIDHLPKKNEKEKLLHDLEIVKKHSEQIFYETNTSTVEEFIEKQRKYHEMKRDKMKIQSHLEKIEHELSLNSKAHAVSHENLLKKLNTYGDGEELSDIRTFLEILTLRHDRQRHLSAQEESLLYTLKSLIGERTIDQVKEEVQTLKRLGLLDENSQESIEEKQRIWEEEEKNLSELLLDLSHKMLKFSAEDPIQIEDEISSLLEDEVQLKRRFLVLETTKDLMESSYKDLRSNYISALNERVSETFNLITKTQRNIKVADHFTMKYEEERKVFIDSSLSKGAQDQLYFALRFAMIDLIFKEETIPVFLDEPFVRYDEERLRSTLEYLHEVEHNRQIFIFTCHEREVRLLREYGHVIELD